MEIKDYATLGQLLKTKREAFGHSIPDLCREHNFNRVYLWEIENEKKVPLKTNTLIKLSQMYETSFSFIYRAAVITRFNSINNSERKKNFLLSKLKEIPSGTLLEEDKLNVILNLILSY